MKPSVRITDFIAITVFQSHIVNHIPEHVIYQNILRQEGRTVLSFSLIFTIGIGLQKISILCKTTILFE